MRTLPPSILVALGLSGCRSSAQGPSEEALQRLPADSSPESTAATGSTGDSGDTYKTCLCACDGARSEPAFVLALPAIASAAVRRRSRREILEDLAAQGTLPGDIAARIEAHEIRGELPRSDPR